MYPISLGDNLKISNVIVTVVSTYYHSLWILYRMSLVLLNKCGVSLSVSWVSTVLFMTLHTLMKCTVIVVAVKNTDKSGNSSNSSTTSSDTSTSLLSGRSIFTYESSSFASTSMIIELLDVTVHVFDNMQEWKKDDIIQWSYMVLVEDLSKDDVLSHFQFQKLIYKKWLTSSLASNLPLS